MFNVHRVGSNTLSVKNIVLLFLTIVLDFASIITLTQVNNVPTIQNAHYTIKGVTMVSNDKASNSNYREYSNPNGL